MKLDEAQAIVKNCTYKPNSSLVLHNFQSDVLMGSVTLHAKLQVPHAYVPNVQTEVLRAHTFFIEELQHLNVERFLERHVRQTWRELEMHEVDEFFKYQGRCVVDPHPKLKR